MQDLPMLPFGVSDFTKIISNNLLYVDKTDLVYKLASQFSLDAFVKIFETILNSTSYGSKFFEDENTLRDLIYLIFVDKGLNCSVEKYHAKGRCDLCI